MTDAFNPSSKEIVMRSWKVSGTTYVGIVVAVVAGLAVGTKTHAVCNTGCNITECFTYGSDPAWPCFTTDGFMCPMNATPMHNAFVAANNEICEYYDTSIHDFSAWKCKDCSPQCATTPSDAIGTCDYYQIQFLDDYPGAGCVAPPT
jgi:hypothetical protein